MNKKLLFFDIDGTLLDEQTHQVPESAKKAINQARSNGHVVIINTGRTYNTIDREIKALQPDGYVCGCGTYIELGGICLHHRSLSQNEVAKVLDTTMNFEADLVMEGHEKVYFDVQIKNEFVVGIKERMVAKQYPYSTLTDSKIKADKFCIWFANEFDIPNYRNLIPEFTYIERSTIFGEVVPAGYSKASGIQFLCDHLQASLNDCLVFGDSNNDLSMIEYVEKSIVMGNAPANLKKQAFYVTAPVDQDGIKLALEHFKLI